jgi:hypothetical protein
MLKVAVVPVQTVSMPLMAAGAEGAAMTDTVRLEGDEVSQSFTAATVTAPPAGPAVTVMEVLSETPVQPSGSVQV